MNLLFPAMLAGLAALAAPVVLHLIARHRFPVYDFPSIRLLQRDVKTNVFAPKLVDVWQLLLRLLVLALAVLAMTRLVGPSSSPAPRNLVVVVDSSASMRLTTKHEGAAPRSLWSAAQAEAKTLLETSVSPGRCALISAGDSTQVLSGLTTDPQAPLAALENTTPSDGAGPGLIAAVAQACDMLRGRRELRSQIVVLTDMRASAFEGRSTADLERIADARRELGDQLDIVFVDVADKTADNLAIVSAEVRGAQVKVGDDAHLVARISNTTDSEQTTKVRLAVSNRDEPLVKEIKLAPGADAVVDLTTRVNRATRTFAQVHLDPHDALEHDDQFDVPLDVVDYRRVLMVRAAAEEATSAAATALDKLAPADDQNKAETPEAVVDGATILRYALNPGRELGLAYGTGIDTTIITPEALVGQPLSKYELVILYDISSLSESALQDLDTFVRQGRAVLIICSKDCSPVKFNRSLAAGAAERPPLAPAQIGNEQALESAVGLAWQGSAHPLLATFSDPLQGDLSVLRFNKLREFRDQQDGTTVTLALAGGRPLAIERPLGLGRVMMWSCGVELDRCNLARARVFPALMWRMVDYLSGALKPSRPDVLVASRPAVLDVSEPSFALATELELTPVGNEQPDAEPRESNVAPRKLPISDARSVIVEGLPAGRYVLHKPTEGTAQVASYSRNIIVQPDARESNQAKLPAKELTAVLGNDVILAAGVFPAARVPTGVEWWAVLVMLLVLAYALEAILGWYQAARRQRKEPA